MKYDIVVTRHTGLIEFLRAEELINESTPILTSATAEDVHGKHVIGVLPLWLAAEAASVTEARLELSVEDRGKEMNAAETREKFRGFFRYETRLVAEQHERVAPRWTLAEKLRNGDIIADL